MKVYLCIYMHSGCIWSTRGYFKKQDADLDKKLWMEDRELKTEQEFEDYIINANDDFYIIETEVT